MDNTNGSVFQGITEDISCLCFRRKERFKQVLCKIYSITTTSEFSVGAQSKINLA